MKINKNLLDQAIIEILQESTPYSFLVSASMRTNAIWERYEELLAKEKKDKKTINIHRLMEITEVKGVEYDHHTNTVIVKTDYGPLIYKTGKYTMDTLVKKVKDFIEKKKEVNKK